jgi:hypothetical protein
MKLPEFCTCFAPRSILQFCFDNKVSVGLLGRISSLCGPYCSLNWSTPDHQDFPKALFAICTVPLL